MIAEIYTMLTQQPGTERWMNIDEYLREGRVRWSAHLLSADLVSVLVPFLELILFRAQQMLAGSRHSTCSSCLRVFFAAAVLLSFSKRLK